MPLTPKYDYASVGGPGVVPLQGDASGNNCGPITAANPMPVSMAGSTGVNSATVQGTSAALAADNADFPVMTGGYASATAPFSATTGQKTKFWTSLNGASVMAGFSVNGADGMSNGGQAALLLSAGGVSSGLITNGYFYNGTTWDRARGDAKGQYVIAAPIVGTDRSITATTTSQTLMASNAARHGFYIKNDSATDCWINIGATAVAAAGTGNIKIPANGGYYESPSSATPSASINIIVGAGTAAITAQEL
jgi:hypothetical protein